MNLRQFFSLFIVSGLIVTSTALAKKNSLQQVIEKHAKAQNLSYEIKKIDEKIMLGTKSQSTGIIVFEKNKIYIEQNAEKKSQIYYKDKILKLVENPDPDFDKDGKRKVTIIKKNIPPLVRSLVSLFSSPKNFGKEFSVISEKYADGAYKIELKSLKSNVNTLQLTYDSKSWTLKELFYQDDVNNKTTIIFSNYKANAKIDKSIFHFKELASDEVIKE